jgi:hypothetical protein
METEREPDGHEGATGGEPAHDQPWEPSEYHFQEPWWVEDTFAPSFTFGVPVAAVLAYGLYRLFAG